MPRLVLQEQGDSRRTLKGDRLERHKETRSCSPCALGPWNSWPQDAVSWTRLGAIPNACVDGKKIQRYNTSNNLAGR